MITVNLVDSSANDKTYGIELVSLTVHEVRGRAVLNRHHPHRIQVWRNGRAAPGASMTFVDPDGQPTNDEVTVLLSPQAIVLTAWPDPDRLPEGEALPVGGVVELMHHDQQVGLFLVTISRPWTTPLLLRVGLTTYDQGLVSPPEGG